MTTPALTVDTWHKCYDSGWNGLIVSEAYSHPAKFSRALIQRIYQHCAAEGWVAPGSTVIDPFGGVALGGLDAALAGYQWLGVELEQRFCALAHGFDCGGSAAKHETCSQQGNHAPHHMTGNLELWQRRYGHLPQWVAPTLVQGDSRRLGDVLREQVSACVASPPFCDSDNRKGGSDLYVTRRAQTGRDPASASSTGFATPTPYGTSPAQLGNLPPGSLDAAIASPPYADRCANDNQRTLAREGLQQGHNEGDGATYGHAPENLGNLPPGSLDACLSSPPFGPSVTGSETPTTHGIHGDAQRGGITHYQYGTSPAQLGNLPAGTVEAAISSPPWEASLNGGEGAAEKHNWFTARPKTSTNHNGGKAGQSMNTSYGTAEGQLGTEHGTTFWEASKQILEQVVALLKPGGVAVFVVKSYVRDSQIVDFPGQWRTLCESLGLVTLHEHHALLVEDHGTQGGLFGEDTIHRTERKSFFRRLHEKKRPDLAINYEVVYCMQKPLDTTAGSVEVCVSSPPYAESLNTAANGIDWSKMEGQTRDRTKEANYVKHQGSGITAQAYGVTEGQLGAMPPGSLDVCLASPPYAGAGEVLGQHNGIDWRKAPAPTGKDLTPGRAIQPYGHSEGQLGSMPAGTAPQAAAEEHTR